MKKVVLVFLAAVAAVSVVVGLSAAATRSGDAATPAGATPSAGKTGPARATVPGGAKGSPATQSGRDVAEYWTKDRMLRARPAGKTVPGGSTTTAPAPSVRAAPSGASLATAPAKRVQKRGSSAASPTGGPAKTDTTEDAARHWTQDTMDSATPMEKTVPGGDGSGQSSPSPVGGGSPAGVP